LADARLLRWKEASVFFVGLGIIAGISCLCIFVLFSANYPPATASAATTVLGLILTGIVSFIGGRNSK
jgi:hypothetical protein